MISLSEVKKEKEMGIIAAIWWTCQDAEGSHAQGNHIALGPPGAHGNPSLLCTCFPFGVLWPALHSPPSRCLSRPHRTVSTPRFLFCSLPMCQKHKPRDCIGRRGQLLQSKWKYISSLLIDRLLICIFERFIGLGTCLHDISSLLDLSTLSE